MQDTLNIPGQNALAYLTLPLRAALWCLVVALGFPFLLAAAYTRAIFMRVVKGRPSQILSKGTYGNVHKADANVYCAHILLNKPIDEAPMRQALVELSNEDGLPANKLELRFFSEVPQVLEPLECPCLASLHLATCSYT